MADALTKSMLGTAVGLQATGLALNAAKLVLPTKGKKKGKKGDFGLKAPSNKKLIKTGVGTIIGVGLLKAQSDIISGL